MTWKPPLLSLLLLVSSAFNLPTLFRSNSCFLSFFISPPLFLSCRPLSSTGDNPLSFLLSFSGYKPPPCPLGISSFSFTLSSFRIFFILLLFIVFLSSAGYLIAFRRLSRHLQVQSAAPLSIGTSSFLSLFPFSLSLWITISRDAFRSNDYFRSK